jgi:tetratricopeptide (TPR) repeat protein
MDRPPQSREFQSVFQEISKLLELSENEIAGGRIMEACQCLLKANSLDQSNLTVFTKLGHCYLLLGNYELSYTCYCKVLQEGSGTVTEEAWYGLGELYMKQQKYLNAESSFKSLLNINPNFEMSSSVYLKLAIIYKKLGNTHKAITFFKASSHYKDLLPNQLNELLIQLGGCFEIIGNIKSASELYVEAVKLNKSARNIVCLAWMLIKNSRFEKAQSLLFKASKLTQNESKEYYDIQFVLSLCHFKNQKLNECSKILMTLVTLYPNEPYYLACFGILEENMNKYSSALHYLWRATTVVPDRHDIIMSISMIYEKIGFINEAVFMYMRIIEMFPWHDQAKTRLRECQTGQRLPLGPLDIINIDITEFPFHRTIEPIPIPQLEQEIVIPKPVYSLFTVSNPAFFQPDPECLLSLPQKRGAQEINNE